MAVAGQALARSPSPRVGLRENRVNALADLAAVYLYLSTEWVWLDEALARGAVGAHLPLARCVASGLSRLVPYRGPAAMRTSAAGSVTDWYREERFVIDHGFLSASVSAAALCEGGPGFLVWSLTGRRAGMIDPHVPERLVFTPGTRFKVLQLVEGRHPLVLMRELFPQESTSHRPTGGSEGSHTAWLDESTVAALEGVVGESRALAVADIQAPQMRAPGLIATQK
ncbi:hypothetical protein [Streptomyces sp. NEAU-W12]|uniref:hypothetical protein n=1 Tax=Streptomyces sp. NEAU-W12 TaxID=2994668 RepID=UPI00224B831F|nr:hypothetical protein [Streptomyces sp. NEAU-W12]MCX2928374.1 hypothetical protein [Streptomyces sp. NEAU-W12]